MASPHSLASLLCLYDLFYRHTICGISLIILLFGTILLRKYLWYTEASAVHCFKHTTQAMPFAETPDLICSTVAQGVCDLLVMVVVGKMVLALG